MCPLNSISLLLSLSILTLFLPRFSSLLLSPSPPLLRPCHTLFTLFLSLSSHRSSAVHLSLSHPLFLYLPISTHVPLSLSSSLDDLPSIRRFLSTPRSPFLSLSPLSPLFPLTDLRGLNNSLHLLSPFLSRKYRGFSVNRSGQRGTNAQVHAECVDACTHTAEFAFTLAVHAWMKPRMTAGGTEMDRGRRVKAGEECIARAVGGKSKGSKANVNIDDASPREPHLGRE